MTESAPKANIDPQKLRGQFEPIPATETMMMSTSADQRNSYSYVSAERRAPLAKRTPIRKNQRSIVPTASADLSFLDDASSIASIPMVDKMASSHPTMAQLPLADKTMENELLFDEGEISLILPPTLIPESLAAVGGGLLKEQDRALDASKREIFSLKLKIYHLEERLRRVTQPAGILHEQLEAQNQELMAQKQQLETQSQQLTTLTRQNESLTVENLTLTRENSALAQRLSTIAEEKSSLVKEGSKLVAEGETVARARDAALAALEAERAMYMEAMERSNQELEHLRVEATIRAREIEHQRFLAQAEVEEAMGRASDTEHRTAVLERKLAEQQDEARQLLDRVAREREVQEAELVRLHTELQQTVATHQQEMAHLTTKLEEERRQRALTIKEATCLQPDTKRQFEALEAELQHTNKELDDTRMQLVRARAELQQVIERKQQEFTSEREALRLEKDALRVAQDSLRAEKEMLRTQREIFVSEYDSDRNSLERQLGEATRALGDAARSYAQSERAREEASRGRRTAEAEVQRLNAELCAIREEATHFLGAYSRERSTENATITALTNERDSLREELQVLRLNAETETASLARFKAEAETERARLQSGFSAQLTRSMEKLRDCELELLRERATIERYERTMAQERDRFTSELQALRATLNDTTKNSTENNREHVHHSNISTDTSLGLIIDAIVAGLSQRLNGTTIQSEAIATDAAVAHLDHLQDVLRLVRNENIELLERLRVADLALVDQRMTASREHVQLEELLLEKQHLQTQLEAQKNIPSTEATKNVQLEAQLEVAETRIQTLSLKTEQQTRTIQRREALIRKAIVRIEHLQAKREALARQLALFFKGTQMTPLGFRKGHHSTTTTHREGRSFAALAQGALARGRHL